MNQKKIHWVLFMFLLMTNLSVFSQIDTSRVNEVVISENRFNFSFQKSNRSIAVLLKEDIEKLPVKSINELLNYVSGVDMRQRGPFGGQADISIDGGSFDQALILLNGAKISDPQTGHHSLNIPIPMDAIERIEILRGGLARVYGINALSGAINIVTKLEDKSSFGVHLQGGSSFKNNEEGKGKYAGGQLQINGQITVDNVKNLIALSHTNSSGQRYNSSHKDYKLFYQGGYTKNDLHKIDWSAGYIDNRFGANGFYAAPGDKESFELVKNSFATLSSSHQLTENFVLKPRITNRNNKDDYRYLRNDLTRARSEHESNVFSMELNSILQTKIGDFGFGVELRNEVVESTNLGNHNRENLGSYFEYRIDFLPKFTLNTGAYMNYNSNYGFEIFPGLDIGYEFVPKWRLTFNVGRSQRIPTFTDLYLNQRPGNIGNPDLLSEHAIHYEASIKGELAGIHLHARYFNRNIHDFIDWVRESDNVPYQPFNFGNNIMNGIGFGLNQNLVSDNWNFKYDLSYNYLQPKSIEYADNKTSKYVVESLRHQGIARFTLAYKSYQFVLANRLIKRELFKAYTISDVRLGYGLKSLNFYADVTNLWNASYKEIAAVPMPSRWYSIGVRFRI